MDEVDEELDFQEALSLDKNGYEFPTIDSFSLTPRLEVRIIALSIFLKPYKYLKDSNKELIENPISPERSQLLFSLISLANVGVNMNQIFNQGDFSYVILENTDFTLGQNFLIDYERINLSHSELNGASFLRSNLGDANFEFANLEGSQFDESRLMETNFKFSNLSNATFKRCLVQSSFNGALLPPAEEFEESLINYIDIENSITTDSEWLLKFEDSIHKSDSEHSPKSNFSFENWKINSASNEDLKFRNKDESEKYYKIERKTVANRVE